jgi:hypothetical protein
MDRSITMFHERDDLTYETTEYITDDEVGAIEFCACAIVCATEVGEERGFRSRDFVLIVMARQC